MPYKLASRRQCFGGTYNLCLQGLENRKTVLIPE
jgi:hypothetical protein